MNSQPTFLFLTYFNSVNYGHIIKILKPDNFESHNSKAQVYKYLRLLLEYCWLWIFPWIELSWDSCFMWDKPGCLNWSWQFLCKGLSSFNPEAFYYSYTWSCSFCEGRTSFCTGLSSRKLFKFLLMSLISFTSISVLFLFPLFPLTFFVFMHSFWLYYI